MPRRQLPALPPRADRLADARACAPAERRRPGGRRARSHRATQALEVFVHIARPRRPVRGDRRHARPPGPGRAAGARAGRPRRHHLRHLPGAARPTRVAPVARTRLEAALRDGAAATWRTCDRRGARSRATCAISACRRGRFRPTVATAPHPHQPGRAPTARACSPTWRRCCATHRLRVHDARIATFGERVEDFFLLSDEHDHALDDQRPARRLARRVAGLRSTEIHDDPSRPTASYRRGRADDAAAPSSRTPSSAAPR